MAADAGRAGADDPLRDSRASRAGTGSAVGRERLPRKVNKWFQTRRAPPIFLPWLTINPAPSEENQRVSLRASRPSRGTGELASFLQSFPQRSRRPVDGGRKMRISSGTRQVRAFLDNETRQLCHHHGCNDDGDGAGCGLCGQPRPVAQRQIESRPGARRGGDVDGTRHHHRQDRGEGRARPRRTVSHGQYRRRHDRRRPAGARHAGHRQGEQHRRGVRPMSTSTSIFRCSAFRTSAGSARARQPSTPTRRSKSR